MSDEEWRNVPGYPRYVVSNLGRVMDRVGGVHEVTPGPTVTRSSPRITLYNGRRATKTRIQLTRLVAMTWLKDYNPKKWVKVKDGDVNNVAVTNLEMTDHRIMPTRQSVNGFLWFARCSVEPLHLGHLWGRSFLQPGDMEEATYYCRGGI